MRGRFSVTVTYPLLLLAIVFGAAMLLGGLGVNGARRVSVDLLDRLTEQSTERMRLAILRNLQGPRKLANLNGELIRDGLIKLDDVREAIPLFVAQLNSFEHIGSILICNDRTDTMWVERLGNGELRLSIFEEGKYDNTCRQWDLDSTGRIKGDSIGAFAYSPPARPWYQTAMAAGDKGAWSPLYPWATAEDSHRIGAGRALAVRDEQGGVMGILDVGLTVDELSAYLREIEVSPRGTLLLLDAHGHLVGTSAEGVSLVRDGVLVMASDSGTPVIDEAGRQLQAGKGIPSPDGGVFGHATFEGPRGETYLLASERLEVDWAPNWRLVTLIPESDLLAGARDVQRTMLRWGILVVLL
ncbi:MAG: cache domain-containing protein, partial [Phycisphaerales bacterium]|nr:cache domain-containing protein [Phycisphaerales bacterium]